MNQHHTARTAAVVARGVAYLALVWVVIDLVLLAFGFVLKLFGANPDAGFTEFVYRSLDRVMEPFRGIFPSASVGSNTADVERVVDTSLLFAMIIYVLVYLLIRVALDWLTLRIGRIDAASAHAEAAAEHAAEAQIEATAAPRPYADPLP